MFRERPTLPRYSTTFDVDIVLRYLTTLPSPYAVPLKELTHRVATLLCILSGQRSQTLGCLSIDFMDLNNDKVSFLIPDLLKQSRPGYHQQPLEFEAYPYNVNLCPVTNVRAYLKMTDEYRQKGKFFVSFAPPHQTIQSKSIARWIILFLQESGVDTTLFKTHATRSAATSKAFKSGMSLSDIGRAAGWKSTSVFQTFYNKPISNNLGTKILTSRSSN